MANEYSSGELVRQIGEVGGQMTAFGAAEGSAGNISTFVRELGQLDSYFHPQGRIRLPIPCRSLARGWVVVSGTGRRLRDLAVSPQSNLCMLHIDMNGEEAELYAARGVRPTSELNSHLAIHEDQVCRRGLDFHAVVHAQTTYLTYLSHMERYADTHSLNRRLLRWEPETVLVFPEGIGMIPFEVNGSMELMRVTIEGLRVHRAVVWQKHGIVTRSDKSAIQAGDLVEYAETAAHFEYLNLQLGEPTQGLTDDEIHRICQTYGIHQSFI
jgi:rhamnulose-1-phosphate aldolase